MNAKNNPAELRELGPMASVFAWLDRHQTVATVLLWLQLIALAYVVITYDFTTRI